MPNVLAILGLLSLTHSAYSATQAPTADIPLTTIVQALASMFLTMAGLVMSIKLIDIEYTGHKDYDTIANRPSLYTFNHRGKLIYPRTACL